MDSNLEKLAELNKYIIFLNILKSLIFLKDNFHDISLFYKPFSHTIINKLNKNTEVKT